MSDGRPAAEHLLITQLQSDILWDNGRSVEERFPKGKGGVTERTQDPLVPAYEIEIDREEESGIRHTHRAALA